jgi:hypothetical protein
MLSSLCSGSHALVSTTPLAMVLAIKAIGNKLKVGCSARAAAVRPGRVSENRWSPNRRRLNDPGRLARREAVAASWPRSWPARDC